MTRWTLSLFVTLGLLGGLASAASADGPNFVLCMSDDQGYGDTGFTGHAVIQTPVKDEMASSGLRLDRFYAAAPVCSPTRGSFLTGRHPNRFGVFQWGHALRPQERTMASALQDAGYATGHFGKWHLGAVENGEPTSPGAHGFDVWLSAPNFYELDPWFSRNGEPVQLEGEGSMVTVEAALEFIEQAADDDEPFLAVIWFGSPHTPHEATDELRELYPDEPEALQNYYGEITGIDRAMGRLRERLRELEIAEDTLLLYTSDNGGREPEADNAHLRGEKGEVWEGGIRVPAVLEWPGRIEPGSSDIPANTSDLYPTLLELAGVERSDRPRPLDGISLVPLIEGEMHERPEPMGFWNYPAQGMVMRSDRIVQDIQAAQQRGERPEVNRGILHEPGDDYGDIDQRPGHAAWMDGDYKLHRLPDRDPADRYELYHLGDDPAEQEDLAEAESERVRQMRAALERWQASVVRSLRGAEDADGAN